MGGLWNVVPLLRHGDAVAHQGANVGHVSERKFAPVNDPAVGAVGATFDMRYALAELRLRQAIGPNRRWLDDMIDGTDDEIR